MIAFSDEGIGLEAPSSLPSSTHDGSSLAPVLEVLAQAESLGEESIRCFQDGEAADGLHLLGLRDELFARAGELLGRLSARGGAVEIAAGDPAMNALLDLAMRLGRLEARLP